MSDESEELLARWGVEKMTRGFRSEDAPRKSDLVDIAGIKRHETEKAFLIDAGNKQVWLPKSLVEENSDGTFTMPEWLADEKELI